MSLDRLLAEIQIETSWRRTRFWLALAGFILFLLVASASLRDRTAGPEWGIATERDGDALRVVWVQPSGLAWDAGVRVGDAILEIDGSPVGGLEFSDLARARTVAVVSGETGRMALLTAREPTNLSLALSLLAVASMFVIIGTSVLLWAPKMDEAFAFYAFSSISAVVCVLAIDEPTGQLWNRRLLFAATVLTAPFLAHFFLVFPQNMLRGRVVPLYLALFVPASVFIALFILASLRWHFLYEVFRPFTYASHSLFSFVAIGAFLWGFVELHREGAAGRLFVPIVGTAVGAVSIAVTTILPMGLARQPLIAPQFSALFGVLIPASFAYAILRHRLLGLSGMIRRAMINFFVGVALLAAFAALSVVLNRIIEPGVDHELLELGVQVTFVAVALIVLPALHSAVRRFVDRVFFRDVYEYDKALQSITRTLASARSADVLASAVADTLVSTLNLSFAAVALRDVGGGPRVIASVPALSPEVIRDIEMATEKAHGNGRDQALFDGKACGMRVMYAPLISGGTYTGLLCLGPKRSGLAFSQRDVNLLTNVATQLAMGLDNARLLQSVQRNLAELQASSAKLKEGQRLLRELNHRLLMAEEKERRRLAADLHDEPLQRIMMLLRYTDSCPGSRGKHDGVCKDLAGQAAATLRRACVDFHPPLLEDLGLAAALDWLVSNVDKSSGIAARIEIDPDFSRVRLRPESQIALYRVVQEAMNNAVRHSEATSILVRLSVEDHGVAVSVKDDGKGFQVPESLSNLSIDGHMGLIGMRERMEAVGGLLEISSVPDVGTEVLAMLKSEARGGTSRI